MEELEIVLVLTIIKMIVNLMVKTQMLISQIVELRKVVAQRRRLILISIENFKKRRTNEKKRKRTEAHDKPRLWKKPSQCVWWDAIVPGFNEVDFISHFRFDRETFNYIVQFLHEDMFTQDTQMRKAIPVEKKIAIALKTLATPCDYNTLAALFGVGKTTIHDCFKLFIKCANQKLVPEHIKWPSRDEIIKKADEFESNWQYPMAVGAIDGCHFHICPPKELATDYYNFKGWYSISALVICDAKYRAIYVKSGFPGRTNDAGAFKSTPILKKANEGTLFPEYSRVFSGTEIPLHLIGDSAFGLKTWLLKPFVSPKTDDETLFNYRLSRARRVIENIFGRVKSRFRRLFKQLEMKIEDVPALINVAIALNNIAEERNMPVEEINTINNVQILPQPEQLGNNRDDDDNGKIMREALMRYFASQQM